MISDNEAGAFSSRLSHFCGNYGMGFRRIGADDKEHSAVGDFADGVCHGAGTEGCDQTGHGGTVSGPGAVVDTVCANHRAHEFLQQIIFFVCAAGGA